MRQLHTDSEAQQAVQAWWNSIAQYKPMIEDAFRGYATASQRDRQRRVKELVSFYRIISQNNHPAIADTLSMHLGQMVLHLRLSYEASLRDTKRDTHKHYQYAQSELMKFQQRLAHYGVIVAFA